VTKVAKFLFTLHPDLLEAVPIDRPRTRFLRAATPVADVRSPDAKHVGICQGCTEAKRVPGRRPLPSAQAAPRTPAGSRPASGYSHAHEGEPGPRLLPAAQQEVATAHGALDGAEGVLGYPHAKRGLTDVGDEPDDHDLGDLVVEASPGDARTVRLRPRGLVPRADLPRSIHCTGGFAGFRRCEDGVSGGRTEGYQSATTPRPIK